MISIWISIVKCLIILYLFSIKCEVPESSSIKGGVKAGKDDFPFIVFINNPKGFGAGAILDEKWVITASHLANRVNSRNEITFIDWKVKATPKSDNNLMIMNPVKNKFGSLVDKKFCLPKKAGEPDFFSDLALLKLKEIIPLDKPPGNFKSITIGDARTIDWNGKLEIAGWGRTEHDDFSQELIKTTLEIDNNADRRCRTPVRLFCATGKRTLSCSGDSGGPAVIKNRKNLAYELVGVISLGDHDCKKFGAFLNVTTHKAWIQNVMTNEPQEMECRNVLQKYQGD